MKIESLLPAFLFIVFSACFGSLVIAFTPPMRGPDEAAHFVRAYGISQGEVIPSIMDGQGRKGIMMPSRLQRQMEVFEFALKRRAEHGFDYSDVFSDYWRVRAGQQADGNEHPAFNLYGGSEGYSPVPYLVYLPAVAFARAAELDFLSTLYLMRATGFALTTAMTAYAIASAPVLQWAFLLVAMLPSALYGRAVVSADGTATALAMLLAAFYLREAFVPNTSSAVVRSCCLALSALCKPPQIAFVLLEILKGRCRNVCDLGQKVLLVTPALVLPLLWVKLSSVDVALWRIVDPAQTPPEYFDPIWRLGFMVQHPWHFPRLVFAALHSVPDYARQLVGVLGWLDEPLLPLSYPLIGALFLVTSCAPLELDRTVRLRLAGACTLVVLGYCIAVFLVFYLIWTPLDAQQVQGVQGRYFVAALPFAAIAISALLKRSIAVPIRATAAILGAAISGSCTLEAVLRGDWKIASILLH